MRSKYPKSVLPQFYYEYLLLLLCFLSCFVFLAFENIFEMKMITYRKYIEKDVVCMLSQQWNIFVIIFFCMLSKDVVCMLSQNKKIFLPMKYIKNINKNIFNNFLIATPAPYFFKNCRVSHLHSHPHPNSETHPCFIAAHSFGCSGDTTFSPRTP